MTRTRLGLVELDLLATHAGTSLPYPLRVPSFGRVPAERDTLFAAAGETLELRNLANANGPTGIAADLVAALSRRRGTVDLVVRSVDGERGAVAIVYGRYAVLCTQPGDDLVEIRRLPLSAVAGALIALVPELAAATAIPVRLPAAAARAARELHTDHSGHQLHQLVEDHGGDPDELDSLTALVGSVSGSGQLGATVTGRNGKDTRIGAELCWLDTPSGRVRVSLPPSDADGWLSVNPLPPDTLRTVAEDLADALR